MAWAESLAAIHRDRDAAPIRERIRRGVLPDIYAWNQREEEVNVDPFDFFDDAIGCIPEWHYTPGWGNLFTVTVATAAIIASVIVSRITLKRNAAQFEQSRLDTRNDKLRAEIAALLSTLGERRDRRTVFVKRISDAAHDLRDQSADPVAQAAALERFAIEARVVFAEQISPVYEKSIRMSSRSCCSPTRYRCSNRSCVFRKR